MVRRYQGFYIPPIPPKKLIGKSDPMFLQDRCFFLNLFFKQFVRCPYLFESDEFQLFIRPSSDQLNTLANMPKLRASKFLKKISPFYTITGEVDSKILKPLSAQTAQFLQHSKENL